MIRTSGSKLKNLLRASLPPRTRMG
jgi:hypothetical protein